MGINYNKNVYNKNFFFASFSSIFSKIVGGQKKLFNSMLCERYDDDFEFEFLSMCENKLFFFFFVKI